LRSAGYRVTCASDAQDPVHRAGEPGAEFAVVLTDFNMPEMSGIDLARVLAQQRPGLPVVITTGYVSAGLRAEAQQIGVRQVLQKNTPWNNCQSCCAACCRDLETQLPVRRRTAPMNELTRPAAWLRT
jgi:CheY-like chemotaxis protein